MTIYLIDFKKYRSYLTLITMHVHIHVQVNTNTKSLRGVTSGRVCGLCVLIDEQEI